MENPSDTPTNQDQINALQFMHKMDEVIRISFNRNKYNYRHKDTIDYNFKVKIFND